MIKINKTEAELLATALRKQLNDNVRAMHEYPWNQRFKDLGQAARMARRVEYLMRRSKRGRR